MTSVDGKRKLCELGKYFFFHNYYFAQCDKQCRALSQDIKYIIIYPDSLDPASRDYRFNFQMYTFNLNRARHLVCV